MNSALWVAKTGLDAQQTRMNMVSNNLANANTTAFKRGRAAFEDLMYQNVRQVGGQTTQETLNPSGLSKGTGVRVVSTEKLFNQGNMIQTENPLDLAIEGDGFFEIRLPDGSQAYTRDGSFQLNAEGEVVTSSGYSLEPGIQIPPDAESVSIGSDGTVSAKLAGQAEPVQLGEIQLTRFINPGGLQARGENLFMESASSGPPQPGTPGFDGLGMLQQGSLESSNVNVVEELVNMIETQRAYEINSKAISSADQMLQFTNQQL
ncbi:flagellar basal-body rod protein FlgG [Gammaproteobacteria bacterium AB-CW1]|uniref:Flagellar basal-body rod protein FlgG n=3 Tax=Natronospira TaxID=2024969 RepID=A0AAP6MKG6_9GAMM|nr:flagellar basal-body rod protein FlgG [Gammaproteobacteria bacterium AB-CW1]